MKKATVNRKSVEKFYVNNTCLDNLLNVTIKSRILLIVLFILSCVHMITLPSPIPSMEGYICEPSPLEGEG